MIAARGSVQSALSQIRRPNPLTGNYIEFILRNQRRL